MDCGLRVYVYAVSFTLRWLLPRLRWLRCWLRVYTTARIRSLLPRCRCYILRLVCCVVTVGSFAHLARSYCSLRIAVTRWFVALVTTRLRFTPVLPHRLRTTRPAVTQLRLRFVHVYSSLRGSATPPYGLHGCFLVGLRWILPVYHTLRCCGCYRTRSTVTGLRLRLPHTLRVLCYVWLVVYVVVLRCPVTFYGYAPHAVVVAHILRLRTRLPLRLLRAFPGRILHTTRLHCRLFVWIYGWLRLVCVGFTVTLFVGLPVGWTFLFYRCCVLRVVLRFTLVGLVVAVAAFGCYVCFGYRAFTDYGRCCTRFAAFSFAVVTFTFTLLRLDLFGYVYPFDLHPVLFTLVTARVYARCFTVAFDYRVATFGLLIALVVLRYVCLVGYVTCLVGYGYRTHTLPFARYVVHVCRVYVGYCCVYRVSFDWLLVTDIAVWLVVVTLR